MQTQLPLDQSILNLIADGNAKRDAKRQAQEQKRLKELQERHLAQEKLESDILAAAVGCLPLELAPYVKLNGGVYVNSKNEARIDLGPDFAEVGMNIRYSDKKAQWCVDTDDEERVVFTVYEYGFSNPRFDSYGSGEVFTRRVGFSRTIETIDLATALSIAVELGESRRAANAERDAYLAWRERAEQPQEVPVAESAPADEPVTAPEPTTEEKFLAVLKDLIRENGLQNEY